MSWVANRVYLGVGNIVGKQSFNDFFVMKIDTFTFKANRVVLRSDTRVRWIFDIGKSLSILRLQEFAPLLVFV